jgi:hypothetical protein
LRRRTDASEPSPPEWLTDVGEDPVDGLWVGEDQRFASVPRDHPFEAVAVGRLDPDDGIEAESAAVVQGEYGLGLMGLQEAVTASRAA